MAFQKAANQPAPRDMSLPYDDVAPGLYPDEVAIRLSQITVNGQSFLPLVAVSVEPRRLENGAGVSFCAWARWIQADGTSRVDPYGQQIETSLSVTMDPHTVKTYKVRPLAKEVIYVLLGEPPQLKRQIPVGESEFEEIPVLQVSEEVRLNVSIVEAIQNVVDTGPNQDPAAILGI